MEGLWGKVLRVNLSDASMATEEIPESWGRDYLGGRGLAARYLMQDVPKGADPLGPDNELIFMSGILGGLPLPSTGRLTVAAKSPLTGAIGHGNSGGFWAPAMRFAGLDGILFQGVSEKPVYLVVDEDKIELRDAGHLWGKNVWEATKIIQDELGSEFEISCIGKAGENLVKYACPINNNHRAPGRCGLGAVMGSKKLKAVAVKGSKEIPVVNKVDFDKVAERTTRLVNESPIKVGFETFGTAMVVDIDMARGCFPTKNFKENMVDYVESINGEALTENNLLDRKACFACPIACGRVVEVKSGPYAGLKGEGPEYESLGAFGGMCFVNNLDSIIAAHNLCDDYGLDVVSAGNTIGFAMECYEKGILTKDDVDGFDLKFGNDEAMLALLGKIAERDGFGDQLAEGVKRMSAKLGKGTEKFAMHVKGLEFAAHDPRLGQLMGLSYATCNRGACHLNSCILIPTIMDVPMLVVEKSQVEDPYEAKVEDIPVEIDLQNAMSLFDSTGACKFMAMTLSYDDWIEMIRAVTGWDFNFDEYKEVGERIYNLERLFNIREGFSRADDSLPARVLEESFTEGPNAGVVIKLDELLGPYYELRGWDKDGKPTPEKLTSLGLGEFIQVIK